jgi:hypothetical protein
LAEEIKNVKNNSCNRRQGGKIKEEKIVKNIKRWQLVEIGEICWCSHTKVN